MAFPDSRTIDSRYRERIRKLQDELDGASPTLKDLLAKAIKTTVLSRQQCNELERAHRDFMVEVSKLKSLVSESRKQGTEILARTPDQENKDKAREVFSEYVGAVEKEVLLKESLTEGAFGTIRATIGELYKVSQAKEIREVLNKMLLKFAEIVATTNPIGGSIKLLLEVLKSIAEIKELLDLIDERYENARDYIADLDVYVRATRQWCVIAQLLVWAGQPNYNPSFLTIDRANQEIQKRLGQELSVSREL
jgi:hypothetical protein